MTPSESSKNNCPHCGGELKIRTIDYFGKSGIIILAVLGAIVTVLFCYTVITTSKGGSWGKVVVFGTLGIFTVIFKISKKQRETLTCPNCEYTNSTDNLRR